jgi:hypothetical protein
MLGLGDQKTKMSQCPHPPREYTMSPTSCKGTGGFTSHGPLGDASKCHKADNQEAFTGLCVCSCRDMLKDNSIPDSWLPSPTKRTKWKTSLCKQQGLPVRLSEAFPFSLINSTLCADLVVSWVNLLPHQLHGGKISWHWPATETCLQILKLAGNTLKWLWSM